MKFLSKKSVIFLILFLFFIQSQVSFGSMLLMVQDTLSTSAPMVSANHTVKFTTNNSIPVGGRVNFRLEPGFFYISNLFTYEEVGLSIRLPGEEEFGYRSLGPFVSGTTSAVSITSGSFGSITITLAEEVPAGSRFEIRLGTHTENGSVGIPNPPNPRSYEFFLETRDTFGDRIDNAKGMIAIVEPVSMELFFDPGIPFRYNGLPEGELPGNTEAVTISLNTDIFAICRFATEPGVNYNSMSYSFSNSYRRLHSYLIDYLENEQEYTFYVRCANVMDDANVEDFIISFSVASAPTDSAEPGDPDDEPDDQGGQPGNPGSGGGSGGGTGSGVGPGSGEQHPPQTGTVVLEGRAYPNSTMFILQDGFVVSEERISDANFSITIRDIEYRSYTYTVYVDDPTGVRSGRLNSTMTVRSDTVNRIGDLIIPPTVSPKGATIQPGETVRFFGYAYPDSEIRYEILKNRSVFTSGSALSLSNGSWDVSFDTAGLAIGTYAFRAGTMITEENKKSDWESVSFGVGVDVEDTYLSADLNRDGRVNLADFSILLFHWGTSNPLADINRDGRVGLPDFSIMLFQWTG